MSNIIPIVSSSPPPYEDNQSFGWGEDDDDFGNFASAPSFQKSANDHSEGGFDVDWSQAGGDFSPTDSDSKSSSPEKDVKPPSDQQQKGGENEIEKKYQPPSSTQNFGQTPYLENGDDGDDEFADFAAFQDDKPKKPHVGGLPLQNTNQNTVQADCHGGVNDTTGSHTAIERSRESTTDSGLFSSDLSPLPKSDSTSDGDKNVHSEDETFSDLPHDVHGDDEADENASVSATDSDSPKHKRCNVNENSALTGDREAVDKLVTSGSETSDTQHSKAVSDESQVSVTSSESADQTSSEVSNSKSNENSCEAEDEDAQSDSNSPRSGEDEDWTGFETFGGRAHPSESATGLSAEPEDLVLRSPSIDVDQDEEDEEDTGDVSAGVTDSRGDSGEGDSYTDTVDTEPETSDGSAEAQLDSKTSGTEESSSSPSRKDENESCNTSSPCHIPVAIEASADIEQASDGDDDNDEFGDFSGQPASVPNPSQVENDEHVEEDSDSPNVSEKVMDSDIPSVEQVSPLSGTVSSVNGTTNEEEEEEDFGDFSGKPADDIPPIPDDNSEKSASDDFGGFSAGGSAGNDVDDDDDDDFGDFSGQAPSAAAVSESNGADDFGAFSSNAVSTMNDDDDDFGDFSSQTASCDTVAADSGWAAFGNSNSAGNESGNDFGDFSEQKPLTSNESSTASIPAVQQSSVGQLQGSKLEKALSACFPDSSQSSPPDFEPAEAQEGKDGSDFSGTLGTILEYGLAFRSASQQTWQVVEHPSKRDPRVKLWHHLQDVDGSPAVVYQWLKSSCNSQLFSTLHIDTRNMLIGHKKPSVPIFATGLSLLEPIRGGGRDRSDRGQPAKEPPPSLVNPNQHDADRPVQDIPAVDFDWSSSGLTNPLTSKSLDLDFLVVQENESSEKLSVFESELLDAPRSNVKPLQPLEDILKSVKPTSVRNRRDDSATSQMSEEALRVLASLPELSFMQSKVLMFPIKN